MQEKTIMSMLSYQPDDIQWSPCKVIAEVSTDCEDRDGYQGNETIGVAQNIFGNYVLFRGANWREGSTGGRCQSITLSHENKAPSLSGFLRDLANQLEELE